MPEQRIVKLSKALSWALRHGILKLNLDMDEFGYVAIDDLLKLSEFKGYTINDIEEATSNNDKNRFTIRVDEKYGKYIRANQGHSKEIGNLIIDELLLSKIDVPLPVCLHGTDKQAYEIIKEKGLSPMRRKHIHFASGLPSDNNVISGMRSTSKVIIYIDMAKAIKSGKTFYLSTNGVILTSDNIEPEFFEKVVMM